MIFEKLKKTQMKKLTFSLLFITIMAQISSAWPNFRWHYRWSAGLHSSSCRSGRGLCFSLADSPVNEIDNWRLNSETKKLTIIMSKKTTSLNDYRFDNLIVFPEDNFIDPEVTNREFNISGNYFIPSGSYTIIEENENSIIFEVQLKEFLE